MWPIARWQSSCLKRLAGVGERVVSHHSLADDLLLQEPVQCTTGEAGDRCGGLVLVDLRLGQP